MEWSEAKTIIQEKIVEGTDLNTKRSTYRKVMQAGHKCYKYDYNGEEGFLVRISQYESNDVEIPWSMLEKCFESLKVEGYSGGVFKHYYPVQAKGHGCHVHVVGMIFKKAGIARSDTGKSITLLDEAPSTVEIPHINESISTSILTAKKIVHSDAF